MHIPLIDLNRSYKPLRKKILREIQQVCDSQHFILGPVVLDFEQKCAEYCGVPYALTVASGTEALIMSLLCLGIGRGDEVITSSMSFIATAESIALVGAKPVFVDVDPLTFNLDTTKLERKITKRTKAIVAVHLYGQMAGIDAIAQIAKRKHLYLIEDAAQAIGAQDMRRRPAGSIGDLGCFSFYPTKNLGGFGEGGLITTHSKKYYEHLKLLRDHGSSKRYYSDIVGLNGRMDALQAAVLRVKFPTLEKQLKERQHLAAHYAQLIHDQGLHRFVQVPYVQPGFEHTYHLYVVRAQFRNELMNYLAEHGIQSAVYYPIPLPYQKCFANLQLKKGSFPEAERMSEEVLALPLFIGLKPKEQDFVVKTMKAFYESKLGGKRRAF